MFNFIKSKLKVNGKQMKQLFMLLLISSFYALILLINFSEMRIEIEKLYNRIFWAQYFLVLGFSVAVMVIAIVMRKDTNKRKPIIEDSIEHISALRSSIIETGLYDDFKDSYLSKKNRQLKLDKYRNTLLNKRDKASYRKKRELANKYDLLYKETFLEGFDIDSKNIKIKELTEGVIFHGYRNKDSAIGYKIDYSGVEGISSKILPSVLFGIAMAVLSLVFVISPTESTADKWKEIITIVIVSMSYILTGIAFADYSVLTVYYMVLQSRADIIKGFLSEKGLKGLIGDNPSYKYKISLEESKND